MDLIWQTIVDHFSSVTWGFLIDLATDYGVFLVGALALYLLMSAGQVSLGHAAMIGISAYAAGVMAVNFGVPFWATIFLSGIVGLASGVVHLDVVDVFPECHVREATSTAAARGERWIHRLSTGEDIEVRP